MRRWILGIEIPEEYEVRLDKNTYSSGRWAGEGLGGEDWHEYIFLERAVIHSGEVFRMLDLGCGYGRWLLAAKRLCDAHRKTFQGVGLDASVKRLAWAEVVHALNGEPAPKLIYGFLGVGKGRIDDSDPARTYGSGINGNGDIEGFPLKDLLAEPVDYLCMDVQGAEFSSLDDSIVKATHVNIAVHDADSRPITDLLKRLAFRRSLSIQKASIVGGVRFRDGIEQWTK